MTIKEFQKCRASVFIPEDVGSDDDLSNCQFVNVPVITPNGVMVNVQKRIKYEELNIPYLTYNNAYMQNHAVKQLKDVPLSSFSVFDALKNLVNQPNEN